MRKRLLTLAYLAEGFSVEDAAVRARLAVHTVREHLRLFREGGIKAVFRPPYLGPPVKLRPK